MNFNRNTRKAIMVKDMLYYMTMQKYKPKVKSLKDITTKFIVDNNINYLHENIPLDLKEYIYSSKKDICFYNTNLNNYNNYISELDDID